jgi:hypothetical protein
VNASVLQGGGDVPGAMQRLHQVRTDSRVQWIERRSAPPPLRFGWMVRTRRRARGERLQRIRVLPTQPVAFLVRPMLELERLR